MIECIFTIDYEIYGNGEGSLRELVYEPAERLKGIFLKYDARFVVFVEVAELEIIEAHGTDPAIDLVKQQIRDFHRDGFELGLHLHPQWYKARYERGEWRLDYSEYNLCNLSEDRIVEIADRAIAHLRRVLNVADFTPLSFRAGNWLFQPSRTLAKVLAERGIKVDSSVFKGGVQHQHGLDYRPALKNGNYWEFTNDVNVPTQPGTMLELPIETRMVPAWEVLTAKRLGLQRKSSSGNHAPAVRFGRLLDFFRLHQPLKFDFCRMTINELISQLELANHSDRKAPAGLRPLVAIGHTKDLIDFETPELLLSYLRKQGMKVSTIADVYQRCMG